MSTLARVIQDMLDLTRNITMTPILLLVAISVLPPVTPVAGSPADRTKGNILYFSSVSLEAPKV